MITKFSEYLSKEIVKAGGKESKGVYFYGLQIILGTIVSYFMIIITGIILNRVSETLVYILYFSAVRIYAGGYHAEKKFNCIMIFYIMYIMTLLVNDILSRYSFSMTWFMFVIIIIILSIIIIILTPVDSVNNLFCKEKKRKLKIKTGIILVLLFICSLYIFNKFSDITITVLISLFWNAILLLLGIIKKKENKRRNEN